MIKPGNGDRSAAGAHRSVTSEPVVPDPVPEAGGDGLAAELAAAAGRRWWNQWTVILGAVVLVLAGFVGGVQVQKSYGEPTAGPLASGQARAQRAMGGFGGPQGGQPGAAAGESGTGDRDGTGQSGAAGQAGETATGTVKLVDGTTVYVETADGTVLTVRTGKETVVRIARDGALSDLKAGDEVTVQGANSAGTVTATTVTGQPK